MGTERREVESNISRDKSWQVLKFGTTVRDNIPQVFLPQGLN